MDRQRGRQLYARAAVFAALAVILDGAGCAPDSSLGATGSTPTPAAFGPVTVTALGRIEPKDPIVRIAGPSRGSVVIAQLLIAEDDRVDVGQPIAILDSQAEDEARVARVKAQVVFAQRDFDRTVSLLRQGMTAEQQRDEKQLALDVARSDLAAAQSALDLDTVRSPAKGQVVALHAHRGERVGPEGIAELAENDQMYAVAEVYETDIARVATGARATIHSPALSADLAGSVERIGAKVGKLDILDTDPVARTDARVVEVRIRLDDSEHAAALSNLQVDVTIEPSSAPAAPEAKAGP